MSEQEIHVLVIDDDEDDFFLLKKHLSEIQGQKFNVHWAPSFLAGKAQLLEHKDDKKFDICFVDYRLGIHTGIDLLKEAIADEVNIPMVLLTGYGQRDVDLEAMRVGAADYLVKDQISALLLEKTIRYAIHRFENLAEIKEKETQIFMQDRLASIGLLASSLAHEIGTPLGVVRGRAEYISTHAESDPVIQKSMTVIVTQIDRISKLIQSLLNLARGDQVKSVGEVQLDHVISDVLDLMGHELKKRGIEVKNEVIQNLSLKTVGGAESLHQVLLNLVVNSMHAIQTSIKKGRATAHFIRFFIEKKDDVLVLCVEDSGSGISKQNLRNLFKPFFTTKDIGAGTGLGLATSYRIVESWGGSIEVESEEDVGTTFRVLLPVSHRLVNKV